MLVACLAHVLRLVVDGDGVYDQSTDALAVLESDVSGRRDPPAILTPTTSTALNITLVFNDTLNDSALIQPSAEISDLAHSLTCHLDL